MDQTQRFEQVSGQIVPWLFHRNRHPIKSSGGAGSRPASGPASSEGSRTTSGAPRFGTYSGRASPVHRDGDGGSPHRVDLSAVRDPR
jgi:hypothetical protein